MSGFIPYPLQGPPYAPFPPPASFPPPPFPPPSAPFLAPGNPWPPEDTPMLDFGATDLKGAFEGRPSPERMHSYMMRKILYKKYYTISNTTPWGPWQPLDAHQQMETRPCHYLGSRTHRLNCGHMVAVEYGAEPCATNCIGTMEMKEKCFDIAIPAQHIPILSKIRGTMVDVVNAWSNDLYYAGDPHAHEKSALHVNVLKHVWKMQELRIQPTTDLISGDYACKDCETRASRVSHPTFVAAYEPYMCIVVGRDERDMAIIQELQSGVVPESRSLKRPAGHATEHIVRESRIARRRLVEKYEVIGRLREEEMIEEAQAVKLED